MLKTWIKYLLCFVVVTAAFCSCDDDEEKSRSHKLEKKLEGTWRVSSVVDEYGEPFYDEEGYEITPGEFGYLRFEKEGRVCYTSSGSLLNIPVANYAVVRHYELRIDSYPNYIYYPLDYNWVSNTFTLKCRYYLNPEGDYLIYFVTFERL